MSTGFVLNIPQEMINRLEDADKKIEKLARTSEDAQTRIVSAFKSINTHGIDAFINKLTEAQTKLANLGNTKVDFSANASIFSSLTSNARKAIDEVNNVVSAIGKIKTASGETGKMQNPFLGSGISEALAKLNAEIEQAKRNFSELQNQFTHLSVPAGDKSNLTNIQNEAQFLMEYIRVLEKEKNGLIAAKNALAEANKTLQQKDPFKAKVDDLSRESLEALRYKDSMQTMKEFYAEQDKEMKKAAKEAEADRKKREKEEKATAERIATYDSKARKERYKAYTSTYEGAMRTSDRAKTLLQEQQAIKNLEAARAKLNKTDSDYANKLRNLNQRILEHKNNIDKATAGSKNLQTQHRSLMDISGQLARRLALVFSVSQITGYVKKLIEVRGEFELQQRSLQAILQNKDEANRIWQQTVDLAVRSPFRVKELVSYTKQLAAYRIESDKLFETNKMLADISAGLGVDMQRLILAFGQVRSAAYLRGTELRQFTEAGIPILEQLAQYFTELEGRAVSVGDVFERVSKRMVSFADVEEIFKRMTSEGGTFYRMQEIQAETLKGMWSNLKDSVDIMVNDIGKGNESTLKSSLSLVKQLVDNWRSVKAVIETAGISLMAYFGVDVLRKIGRGIKALYATISAHPLLAIVSVLGLIATAIWRVREAQNALTAAMSEVDNEILGSLEEGIGLYHKLAEAVNDATKSSEERNKALDNLKSRFQDILPDQYLELEYIKQIGDNYKDAEKAMTDYYDAKAQAQKKDRIEGLYTKELDTDTSELISATRDVVSKLGEKGIISGEMQTAMLSGISGIVNKVVEDVKAGKIDANIERIQGAIFSKLEDYAGYEGYLYGKISESPSLGLLNFGEQVSDVTDTLREYLSALEDIQGLPYETYGQKVAGEWLNKEKESLRQISEIYKKLLSLYSKYSKATDEDKVDIADDISLAMSQVPENLNAYLPLLQESVDKMKGIAEKGAFEFTASMQTLESDFIEGLAGIAQYAEGEIGDVNGDKIAQTLSGNLQEGIKTASDKLDMTPFQNAVVGGARQIAAKFGQDVNIFEKFIPNQKESLSNIRQEVKSQIESFETQILEMQTSLTQGMYVLSEDVLNNTKETIKSMTDQLPALKAFLAFLGEMEKDKGRNKTIDEKIKVVDQMNAKYKELNKTLSKAESLEGAFEAYKDAFATAYGREDVRQMSAEDFAKNVLNFPDENAVIDWLDNLAKTVKDKEDKFKVQMAKGKFEMDVQVRLKKEDDQQLLDDIQELFDQYDLSLELKKLNIPPDLAKSLFDVDYLDLDGLKKAVQAQEAKFIGTDMEDEYKKFLEKINDLSRKQREDEAKEFINFLKKNLDEVKLIQDKGAYNISLADKLFGQGKITTEQYMSAIRQIVEETNKETSRVSLENFKESPKYIQAMGDMTAYTASEVRELIKELENVVAANSDAFSADEAKAYIDAIYNAQEKLDELEGPVFGWETFDKIGDILETNEEINEQKEERVRLQEQEKTQLEELARLEKKLKRLQEEKNAILSGEGDLASKANRLAPIQSDIDATTQAIQTGQQAVAATQSQAKTTESILGKLGDKMKGLTGKGGGAASTVAIIDAIINGINDTVQGILDITNEIGSVMESFGKETDMSTGFGKFQKGFAIFAESSQHAADGWNALKNGDPVGAVVSVVKSVTSLIRGINEYKDAKFQVEIDKQVKEVERLGKAYEKLEQSTEKAYSIEQLQKANTELERNVELQIASYKAMIAAENAKKNTDTEQIAAWNEELEALTKQWEDLKDSLLEGVGGVAESNFRSQTREFVDSWVSAFKETGNGLSGLKENFREFFDNIIAEQASLRVTEKFLAPFYESLNTALDDLKLSVGESKDLREEADRIMPELSKALELIWNELGGSRGEAEGAGLSALSKSIQGVSESTAQVLESLLNSMRFYVADSNAKLTQLLNNMMGGETESPMLSELRAQTKWMRDIYNLINGMTATHPSGGRGIKTVM